MKKMRHNLATVLDDIFVSAVVIIRPEATKVAAYITELAKILSDHYTNYEVIIIDNGASEKEFATMARLLDEVPCLRLIRLTRQFKYDSAVFAGLEVSIGDYVCTLDPMTDNPKELPNIIKVNKSSDVIQGVSVHPLGSTLFTKLGRRMFYWYNRKYIGIDIPLNATYYAAYTRRAVNSLTANSTRHHRHIRHQARRVGLGYVTYDYTPLQDPNNQKSLRTGVIEALEIATSYSTHPLRFVTWLGVFASLVNVIYAFYVVFLNLSGIQLAPGWTSTSMQLALMFFVLFLILIILSEYIGRLLTEVHKDPHYFILDELNSTIGLANKDRRNISK